MKVPLTQLVDDVTEWLSVLEVKSVTVRDYMNYTCAAHNSQGSNAISFFLTPPILPAAPSNFNVSLHHNLHSSQILMHRSFHHNLDSSQILIHRITAWKCYSKVHVKYVNLCYQSSPYNTLIP